MSLKNIHMKSFVIELLKIVLKMFKILLCVKSCTDSPFLQQLNAVEYLDNADESVLAFLNHIFWVI